MAKNRQLSHRWHLFPSLPGLGILLVCIFGLFLLYGPVPEAGRLHGLGHALRAGPYTLHLIWGLSALIVFGLAMVSAGFIFIRGPIPIDSILLEGVSRRSAHGYLRNVLNALLLRSEDFYRDSSSEKPSLSLQCNGLQYRVDARRRCCLHAPLVLLSWKDPLGLWKARKVRSIALPLQILPPKASGFPDSLFNVMLGAGEDMVQEGKSEGDHLEMREYRMGDSARMILWKLFARTGELYVRTPETTGGQRFGVFFCSGIDDTASARLARHFLEEAKGLNPNWIFQCPGMMAPLDSGSPKLIACLAESGNDAKTPESGDLLLLNTFLTNSAREQLSAVLVFFPEDEVSFRPWVACAEQSSLTVIGIRGLLSKKSKPHPGFMDFGFPIEHIWIGEQN